MQQFSTSLFEHQKLVTFQTVENNFPDRASIFC